MAIKTPFALGKSAIFSPSLEKRTKWCLVNLPKETSEVLGMFKNHDATLQTLVDEKLLSVGQSDTSIAYVSQSTENKKKAQFMSIKLY